MSLTPAFLDELRARTTLSALIGRTVKITRAGREWKACCPFHNEKTPSFYINDDKGFYHCFGCSAHGDAIRWLTDQQGLPFMDAVKELAAAAGMDVPQADPRAAEKAERARGLHELMADAAQFFVDQLHGIAGAEARAVLERRGINADTSRAFGLGYAPDSRTKLRETLKSYGDAMLVEAGMLIAVDNKEPYDRFRGRLMIPIHDARGRVIAFGGRVIGEGEPKYLNSPETPLFDKGRTLYNLDRAAAASRKSGRIIAVEGYMDVIALAQAGFGEAVAPLGTALTEHQIERLWRMADVPLLAFDGDGAGQKAAIRAAHRALPHLAPGRSLAFVTLPNGQDPDDLVRGAGPQAFEQLLAAAQPLADRIWSHELAAEPLETPEARAGLKRRLSDLAGTIQDGNVRHEYVQEFRNRFDAHFAPAPRNFARKPAGGAPARGGRPGQRWQPPEAPPGASAQSIGTLGIDTKTGRAIVTGLILHPREIGVHVETLERMRFADRQLERLLDYVVEQALAARALDSERLRTILLQSEFAQIVAELLRPDTKPPYSFCSKAADPGRAVIDLRETIEVVTAKPQVDAALAEATAAVQARFSDEAFERQVALVRRKAELESRLANLMLADDE